jgi:hypothetical protein
MPSPNKGVMHDMITSGSMAAASSPGFFTQEEARATEAVAVAAPVGVVLWANIKSKRSQAMRQWPPPQCRWARGIGRATVARPYAAFTVGIEGGLCRWPGPRHRGGQ